MSFLVPLALLSLLLTAGPIVAHALRRGKAPPTEFPAARLVAVRQTTARSQNRLQDRNLLLLRLLLISGLALLGASPLLSCSRLSLSRASGSSIAVALVIDDSASMRARLDDQTKFSLATHGAQELLSSARVGDAFSIVLSGKPARILTPATTDLSAVRQSLETLKVSDRPTDLGAALRLAETTLDGLPQESRQVVVLSDMASEVKLTLPPEAVVPLTRLSTPLENCAVFRATLQGESVVAEIGCTSQVAAQGRQVELVNPEGRVVLSAPLEDSVSLSPKHSEGLLESRVRLTPPALPSSDQIPEDDESVILMTSGEMTIAVRADEHRSGLRTSGSTVLGSALGALEGGAKIQPLTLLPTRASELGHYAALFIDDPAGFTPETAQALDEYVRQGGVLAAFLGPQLKNAPLGSTFQPLLEGAPTWSRKGRTGIDPHAELGLGPLTEGWSDLVPTGRAILGQQPDARALARFTDGEPLLLEQPSGRGLILISALPTSLDESDFALRPAFLALLDHIIHEAGIRNGAAATRCGTPWELPPGTQVEGPRGPVQPELRDGRLLVEPAVAGRYHLRRAGLTHVRHAVIDPEENLRQPEKGPDGQPPASAVTTSQKVDVSREVALVVLLLALSELAFRMMVRRRTGRNRGRGPELA